MCDPKDLPGLAHFCEHMLFLGTEKYPVENEYPRFLSEHGMYIYISKKIPYTYLSVYYEFLTTLFPPRWKLKCLYCI